MGFKVYQAMADGGHVEVRYRGEGTFKNNEVFVIESEETRRIFIWVGSEAPVRMKFVSSQLASQLRMSLGLTYKISTIEQGIETTEFWEVIGAAPPSQPPVIGEKKVIQEIPAGSASPESPISLDQQIENLEKRIPKKTPVTAGKRPIRSTETAVKTEIPAKSLMEQIEEEEVKLETDFSQSIPVTASVPTPSPKPEMKVSSEQEMLVRDFIQKTAESSPVNVQFFHECSVEEMEPVPVNRARRLVDNRTVNANKNVILNRIFISVKEKVDGGTLEFYPSKNSDEEEDCTYRAPICKIFLHDKQTGSYLLHIVVPQGASLYYTCPAGIFFSLMFAEV